MVLPRHVLASAMRAKDGSILIVGFERPLVARRMLRQRKVHIGLGELIMNL
jgi:hypothetical protein